MKSIEPRELIDNIGEIAALATGGEEFSISGPKDEKLVLVSEEAYARMSKALRNAEYLAKLDRSIQQLKEGRVVIKTIEELEEMAK